MARTSLPGSLARGLVAGWVGTALMTAYQLAVKKARGERLDTPVPRTWREAPPPAQVVKKGATALGRGQIVTKEQVPLVTNVMHWLYGTSWGVAYGVAARRLRPDPVAGAAGLGGAVWATAYAELVPLGIYKPPWRYPPSELALDLSYHLVYGAGVAAAYATLER
jgi:uncharacterized membrane protein YagU involved in acid resistance